MNEKRKTIRFPVVQLNLLEEALRIVSDEGDSGYYWRTKFTLSDLVRHGSWLILAGLGLADEAKAFGRNRYSRKDLYAILPIIGNWPKMAHVIEAAKRVKEIDYRKEKDSLAWDNALGKLYSAITKLEEGSDGTDSEETERASETGGN